MNKREIIDLHNSNFVDLMKKRYEILNHIRLEKENALLNSPNGKLRVVINRNRAQFYLRSEASERTGVYISKNDNTKIKMYLQKKYNEKIIGLVKSEISLIENSLGRYQEIEQKMIEEFSGLPNEVKQYISPIDCSDEDYIKLWMSREYVGKEIGDDVSINITDRGEKVRSKSELNIANRLYKNNIPYKYECPFKLKNGLVIYPDFTVLDVKNRRNIYWEHRGMMDDREYAKHAVQRIKEYQKNDVFLGKNLIITEETSSTPLGTQDIDMIIRQYF